MIVETNPVRPDSDPAEKPGPECEVNAVDDEDEIITRAMEEAGMSKGESDKMEDPPMPPPMHNDSAEAVQTRPLRRPGQPTRRQIQEHRQASHLPYRSWCKLCVEGKGCHDHHRSGQELDKFE